MADKRYRPGSLPDGCNDANDAPNSVITTIIAISRAGFRLSLLLNAVGVEMTAANREIQATAKEISLFSLMLKQVGLAMDDPEVTASPDALETARGIAMQSQTIFAEIKDMVEMSRNRDEHGNVRSITVAGTVQSWFHRPRVQYLLGQLVSLKLSLAIMLQVFHLGKSIARTRRDNSRAPPTQRDDLQERAEIQNMVVVRHWSLVDLQRLYRLADDEAAHPPPGNPPPENRERQQIEGDSRLSMIPAAHEENPSKAVVKYQETPLSEMETSLNKAMYQPNQLLRAPDTNIVDVLLRAWIQSPEIDPRPENTSRTRRAHVESDTDDSDSEFERPDVGGYYLEGAPRGKGVVKNVRFRARVEDGEDSDQANPRRRAPKQGIIRSDSEDSSSFTSDSEGRPSSRRSSASSTTSRRTSANEPSTASRRYVPAGVYNPNGSMGMPDPARGHPPSPRLSRPMPIPSHWRAPPASPSANQYPPPPLYHPPSAGPPRLPMSGSPYRPPTAPGPGHDFGGYSPHGRGNIFPPQPPPSQQAPNGSSFPPPHHHHPPHRSEPRRSKPRSQKRDRADSGKGSSFKENAKKDVKRGLLGAGAVAGLMDILDGLSSI